MPTNPFRQEAERFCGECRECCHVMGFRDFKGDVVTEPMSDCKYCSTMKIGGGCTIYKSRPEQCRDFLCTWAEKVPYLTNDEDRPDKTGIVQWVWRNRDNEPVIGFAESRADAFNSSVGERMIKMACSTGMDVKLTFKNKRSRIIVGDGRWKKTAKGTDRDESASNDGSTLIIKP